MHLPLLSFANYTIKSRKWRAVMEEADKGCSEFCITVGTATRTAGILIHGRLKVLAVSLRRPSGRLWLYAGLIGSNNPRWLKADRNGDELPRSGPCCLFKSFLFLIGVSGWGFLLVPVAHLGSPGQRAVKQLYV